MKSPTLFNPTALLLVALLSAPLAFSNPKAGGCSGGGCENDDPDNGNQQSGCNTGSPSSIETIFSLGFVVTETDEDYHKGLPSIHLWQESVTEQLFSRGTLYIANPQNTEVVRDSNDWIRQIKTQNAFVDFQDLPSGQEGFEVKFYNIDQASTTKTNQVYTVTAGVPFVTYKISNPDAGTSTWKTAEIETFEDYLGTGGRTEYIRYENLPAEAGDTPQVVRTRFTRSDDAAHGLANQWEVVDLVHTSILGGETGEYTVYRRTQLRGSNGLATVEKSWERHAEYYLNDPVLLESRTAVSGEDGGWTADTVVTRWTYEPDGGSGESQNKPTSMKRYVTQAQLASDTPDYWENYLSRANMSANVRIYQVTSPWADGTVNKVDRRESNLYPDGPSMHSVTIGGQQISSSTTIRTVESNGTDLTEGTSIDHSGGTRSTTVSRHYNDPEVVQDHLRGRVQYRAHPDGTYDVYSYSLNGEVLTITKDSGQGSPTAITNGIRMVSKYHLVTGYTQEEASSAIEGGAVTLLETKTATEFTKTGRPVKWIYDGNPSDYETTKYDEDRLIERRSRDGLTTTYEYDLLDRETKRTVRGGSATPLEYHTRYDGLTTTVEMSTVGGSKYLVSEVTKDQNGDLLSREVPALVNGTSTTATTSYSHDRENRTVTMTNPDGGTVITETYPDGQHRKTIGTAANPYRTEYAVSTYFGAAGLTTTRIALADAGSSYADTSEESTTFRDPLGNTLYRSVPDDASDSDSAAQVTTMSYDSAGRLTKTIDPDGVSMLYAYNARGQRSQSVLDRNGNDLIDSGTDTIRETTRSFDSTWPSSEGSWKTVSQLNGVTTATRWTTHDGLTSRTSRLGVSGYVTTSAEEWTERIDGSWSETSTDFDGTQSISTYSDWRMDESLFKDNGGTTITSTEYGYNAYGQNDELTHARTGTTTLSVDIATGLTTLVTDPGSRETEYRYDNMGRTTKVILPDDSEQQSSYTVKGQLESRWGSQTYPTFYTYDAQGRLKTLKTYRSDNDADNNTFPTTTADTTTWNYYPATGLLKQKLYADNDGPEYTYTPAGRLQTRQWERGTTTTYSYEDGELTSTDYSDSTPDISYSYDPFGRLDQVTDATGTRSFTYDSTYLRLTNETLGSLQGGKVLTYTYDSLGRRSITKLGQSIGNDSDQAYEYQYDDAGRLYRIIHGKAALDTFTYTFEADSYGLVKHLSLGHKVNGSGTSYNPVSTVTNTWDSTRDLLLSKKQTSGWSTGSTLASWDYNLNSLGQRTGMIYDGSMVGINHGAILYAYNEKGEIIESIDQPNLTFGFTGPVREQWKFEYDEIGNRKSSRQGSSLTNYTANQLNLYSDIAFPSPHQNSAPTYDADGNLTQLEGPQFTHYTDDTLNFVWNGQNRLIEVIDEDSDTVANYIYDYLGRRVMKFTTNESPQGYSRTFFVYDGWNVIAEYKQNPGIPIIGNATNPIRILCWGRDLSGSLQGAGGVGGLLSIKENSGSNAGTYYFGADGNGNIATIVERDGSGSGAEEVAYYGYDAFGNDFYTYDLDSSGYVSENRWRFSSKRMDEETGFYYYGFRYYEPVLGRWLNRDPIGELGGINLNAYLGNEPINHQDLLGFCKVGKKRNVQVIAYYFQSETTSKLRGLNVEMDEFGDAAGKAGLASNGKNPAAWGYSAGQSMGEGDPAVALGKEINNNRIKNSAQRDDISPNVTIYLDVTYSFEECVECFVCFTCWENREETQRQGGPWKGMPNSTIRSSSLKNLEGKIR